MGNEIHKDDKKVRAVFVIDASDVKRLPLQAVLKSRCPTCDSKIQCNLNEQHLNYPKPGEKSWFYFYCDECFNEYEVPIEIGEATISIDIGPEAHIDVSEKHPIKGNKVIEISKYLKPS